MGCCATDIDQGEALDLNSFHVPYIHVYMLIVSMYFTELSMQFMIR